MRRKLKRKSRYEGDANDSSSMNHLPDEIILQILNKVIDLKSLCCCYLVSKRFSSIVLQVEAISFTAPVKNPNTVGDVAPSTYLPPRLCSFYSESFLLARNFLNMFRGVKSLCVQFPSSSHHTAIDNSFLFKWKVNFCSRVESLIFLSPNSICDKDGFYLSGNREEEEEAEDMGLTNDFVKQKFSISLQFMTEVVAWHIILMDIVKELPKLEEVSVTGSGRRGRLSLSGEKLNQVKEWAHSASETEFEHVVIPKIMSKCYIPVLRLPVSGYVMKGVFCALVERHDLQGGNDGLMNSDEGFEDKEGAAYTEAVREILMKDMMRTYHIA